MSGGVTVSVRWPHSPAVSLPAGLLLRCQDPSGGGPWRWEVEGKGGGAWLAAVATQGQGNWAVNLHEAPHQAALSSSSSQSLITCSQRFPSGGREGRVAEPASRWPFWRAWASSGLYVRVALLPRLPSRQTFKHLFCVYDTEEEIKRPPGEKEKERKKKQQPRSDSGGLSGRIERETRSGTGFKRMTSRWLPWVWVVRSRKEGEHPSGDKTGQEMTSA